MYLKDWSALTGTAERRIGPIIGNLSCLALTAMSSYMYRNRQGNSKGRTFKTYSE